MRGTHKAARRSRAKRGRAKSSSFNGVGWHRGKGKWRAWVYTAKGKQTHVGYFADEVEAARAYDARARIVMGPNSPLNFPAGELSQ